MDGQVFRAEICEVLCLPDSACAFNQHYGIRLRWAVEEIPGVPFVLSLPTVSRHYRTEQGAPQW